MALRRQRDAIALRPRRGAQPEKVLTVSCHPDLKSKQLVALTCSELFLVNRQWVARELAVPQSQFKQTRDFWNCPILFAEN